jgi:HAD superfamily hydrolase (TIGR01509 family)
MGRAQLKSGRQAGRIEAILWDQDGLLVDTERLYFRANRETLRGEGIVLTRFDYQRLFLRSNRGLRAIGAEQGWSDRKLERVRAARNRRYSGLLRTSVRPMPWARTVLRVLSSRFRMAVVTSSYREHVRLIDRKVGFLRHMELVVADGDFAASKPDPEPYSVAIRRLGLRASQCVAVEDSERGLIAARAAGLRCIVVPNALTQGGDFGGAWRVLQSLRKLPRTITQNGL